MWKTAHPSKSVSPCYPPALVPAVTERVFLGFGSARGQMHRENIVVREWARLNYDCGFFFLIICPSNYVSLISLSPLNNQVLVYGEQHQIEAQFNFTLLQDSEGCSDYSACSQSPLNHYFSLRYLHGAPSLFLSRSLSVCTTCFVFFFIFSFQCSQYWAADSIWMQDELW